MPEPVRQRPPQIDPAVADGDAVRRPRVAIEDPLEELARILGEAGGYPAKPEPAAEPGRRANASRPAPQQLSALEAELFDELRASVTPDVQVRGNFEREVPAPIPQHPVDDRDIASLRIAPEPETPELPRSAEGTEARWSDFYAYDDGVAAGSYDPAFAHAEPRLPFPEEAVAPPARPDRPHAGQGAYPHATFDEFGRDEIAAAAREAVPAVAAEPRILPHSREEQRAAARLPHEDSRRGFKIAVAALVLVAVGGGALAAWKLSGSAGSGEPVTIHADGKPLKTLPDPSKTASQETTPSLSTDNPKTPSRIVSMQEDPVDQVNGRTAEGKEVRLVNPGAQRPTSDVPHTVKTVVVRPDGSIVTDAAAPRPARPQAPAAAAPPSAAPTQALPPVPAPTAAPVETAATPASTAAAPPEAPAAAEPRPIADTPLPMPRPALPAAAPPPPVKTVAVTPITVARPGAPAPAKPAATPSSGAPMALGPVPPRLAATQPAAAAAPKPAAPVAIAPPPAAGGDWMVQISASQSDAAARASFAAAQRRHPALAGRSLDVQRADLGAKGVYYRARVAAGSRDQAATLCSQIQGQGGQCMVVRR